MRMSGALTPVRKTTVIGVALLLLGLIAAWMFLLSPRSEAVGKVKDEITVAAAANASLRNQIATLRAQQAQLPELRVINDAINDRFPVSAQQPQLFRMITAAAAEAGIAPQSLTNLNVDPPTSTAGLGQSAAQLPGARPLSEIAAQRVSMNVAASPAQIRDFVANLEKLPRAFAITSIGLVTSAAAPAAGTTAPVATGSDLQTATISGEMFVMPKLADPQI